jgi:hypothetical protein
MIHGMGFMDSSQIFNQSSSLSSLKLPVLRQVRKKIPEENMNEKRGINRSYSRKYQGSLDCLQKRIGIQEEVFESKLNRSVILKNL